ncbi:MAG: hypothetical protein HY515_04840 [Candidatus Aenigmarchaeota archaeon]|nr:hypothetical protein [Candidatus Aenigmarchaeota archaeon]
MCALFVYAERFSPVLGKSGFPTFKAVERYEREVDERWNNLQTHLAGFSYHRQTAMPIKGTDFPLMGVHFERGQMLEKDPFTDFYALLRYRDG